MAADTSSWAAARIPVVGAAAAALAALRFEPMVAKSVAAEVIISGAAITYDTSDHLGASPWLSLARRSSTRQNRRILDGLGLSCGTLRVSNYRKGFFTPAVAKCQPFPTVTPHDFRHTAASLGPPRWVARLGQEPEWQDHGLVFASEFGRVRRPLCWPRR